MIPPRIRGRAGIAQPGQGVDGKWFFEITVWDLAGEKQFGDALQLGPFETEEIAKDIGFKATREVSEAFEKQAGFEPSGKFLDLKNGAILRSWESH